LALCATLALSGCLGYEGDFAATIKSTGIRSRKSRLARRPSSKRSRLSAPGTLKRRLAHHALQNCLSQSSSAVGLSRSTGGSSSNTPPREGRDTAKLPQIMVEIGCASPP
jgi:hypothetical protein